MRKSVCLIASFLVLSAATWAGPVFVVAFDATFNSGFGGLPTVQLTGSYTFEVQPPTSMDATTATYSMRSASFTLDGIDFAASPLEIRIDNNIDLGGGVFRDAYYLGRLRA